MTKKGRGVDAADSDGLRDRCCHRKAILHSRLAGNKSVRRKASFRLQQECLNAAAKCFIVGLHGRCTEIMCFPSLAKPLSGYYCRIWAWHIEPERDGERQHCCCKSLQREDEGSMSNPEWCRVIYDGLLASGSTAMFYRQAMMRGRQLHPCVAGEGPDRVGRGWDRACCRDKGPT
jgi:hypothetical protein